MNGTSWMLEIVLIGLLAATLFHAVRLERALGVLKRDRAVLEGLVSGFNAATRQAEAGIDRLRGAVDGAGRQVARQIDAATLLRDDLRFLIERGEKLADRLDDLVRRNRVAEPPAPMSQRGTGWAENWPDNAAIQPSQSSLEAPTETVSRVRSQAERDLIRALRTAR